MLKQFLLTLTGLQLAFAGSAAQLSATLQSGDKVTPFYGANALVEAHKAAIDGDIITLSPGEFNTLTITKSITVIGTYGFGDDPSKVTWIGKYIATNVNADNVTIEGIRALNISVNGAQNLSIFRSQMDYLSESENGEKKLHDNTILTDCLINDYCAMALSRNTVLRNCYIWRFYNCNQSSYPALIENCNIAVFHKYNSSYYYQPYAVYRNCYLGLYKYTYDTSNPILNLYSPSEFQDVYFYTNYYYASSSSYAKPYSINFGSCSKSGIRISSVGRYNVTSESGVYKYSSFLSSELEGITYGPSDHKDKPSNPVITSSEIDTETDTEGKLHVKITAEARD